jgi:hypothetical protein
MYNQQNNKTTPITNVGWLYICNRSGFIAMVGYTFVIGVVLLLLLVIHLS